MIINDYSNQEYLHPQAPTSNIRIELITAGIIFIAPIIFLLIISN